MAIDTKAADLAAQAAKEAALAAAAAQDAAETEWLASVKKISEITAGRTVMEGNRLKCKYITKFGFSRWQSLVADSR